MGLKTDDELLKLLKVKKKTIEEIISRNEEVLDLPRPKRYNDKTVLKEKLVDVFQLLFITGKGQTEQINILLDPPAAVAGQVQILGLNGRLEYGINKDDQYLGLDYFNEETQVFTYITERNEDGVIEIPIKIKGKSTDLDMSYKFVDQDGNVISQATQSIKIENIPEQFKLHQNYPNPFNPVTTINYDLPQQTHVNLLIYDILGREVVKLVSEEMPAGYKTIIWDSRNNYGDPVSAGIYFYQIQTKDFVKTRKMVLLK